MYRTNFKILAVDDIPDNLISLKALIREAFPEAVIFMAQNGKQALSLATEELPDIILLDIVMPGMDGYEVCRQLKANHLLNDIPVVFITALKGDRESRIMALEAGAEGFIAKPIDETELTAQIKAMLKIRDANLKSRDEKSWLELQVKSRTAALEKELTERKKAELALKLSEAKFRSVFEASNVGKSITGIDGKMFANQAFCDMLGYSIDELADKSWQDITPPEDIVEVNQKIGPLLKGEISTARFTKRYIHKNGSYIITDLSTVIQRDDNNNPVNFITTVVNITEQKKAKEAIRQSEAMANALLNGLPESAFLMKPDGTVIAANKTVADRLNTTVDALINNNIYRMVYADTANTRAKYAAQVVQTKKPVQFIDERFGKTIDNRIHPVFDAAGNVESLAIIGIDITDRKEAEQKVAHQREMLARTEHIARVGSWEWDIEPDVVYWSDELFTIFGLTPQNTAPKFAEQADLYISEDYEKLKSAVSLCVSNGLPYEMELKIKPAAGPTRYCVARGLAVKEENGKTIRLAGSLQDIDDRKRVEAALAESEEKFRTLVNKMQPGLALHDMIFDQNGKPSDYRFVEINPAFERMTGLNREVVLGKTVLEVLPETESYWVETYGKVVLAGEPVNYENYSQQLDRYFHVVAYKNRGNEFAVIVQDITEHKKAELALIASEERFALVIEATEQGIWDWNLETNEVFFSEQWKKIIGYNNDELQNEFSTWVDHLHPDERESCMKSVENYLSNPKAHFILEFRMRHKDGSYRWIHNKAATVENCEGKVIRMFGAHTDITERKKAEKALKHASENWNTTFRAIKSGILLIDEKQRIIQSNKAFQDFVGKTTSELYQNCCYNFVHGTECAINDCPFTRMKNSKKRESLELTLKGKDYEVIVDPILDGNNEISGAVHILNDISQRKKDEKIQQVLFEIARNSVTTKTIQELLVEVRRELHKVIDTTNFFVALHNKEKNTLSKIIFEDEHDDFIEWGVGESLSGYVVKTGKSLLIDNNNDITFCLQNGIKAVGSPAQCWLGVPLNINDETVGAMVVQSYTDPKAYDVNSLRLLEMIANELALVIERNQMIDDLIKARMKAEESDRLKSAFLANMSHEIRTPMNGILGFTNLLNEPTVTESERQYFITIIQKSGDRLLNTVNDLIDISKIETGQMQVVITGLHIVDQLSNLHQFFKPQATEKNLRFLFVNQIADDKAEVKTDMTKFDSIITNLIKNAIKYTDYGTIELGCFLTNDVVSVYVKDTGIGIPEDRQTAVFNRFEQADIGDRRAYQGSGLGLAIAKAYAEMLGGSITLKSKPGEGSTFTFSFQSVQPEDNLFTDSFKRLKITGPEKLSSKLKIAIAEDDDTSILYLKSVLKDITSSIVSCVNGAEIVEQCRLNPDIDVVLMDIRMPVMDGYEATRKIREFNKEVIIIAQTAFALVGDREKAIHAGCNAYISKPVQKNELLGLIKKNAKTN